MLGTFTDKCLSSIQEVPDKIKRFREICQEEGAKVVSYYLLMGQYDIACVIDSPNPETIAKIALIVGKRGNVRTETLCAFPENDIANIIKKMS